MNIALAFNQRGAEGDDPLPAPCTLHPQQTSSDLYAEWDDEQTIAAVASALAQQHQVSLVNADLDAFERLRGLKPDLVFNMSEGLFGGSRESQIPALLEMLQIPYTGSDPLTLGLCLDKYRTKEILSYNHIATPDFVLIDNADELPAHMSYPLLVKPPLEGSSKGITDSSLVRTPQELQRELVRVRENYAQQALVEEFLCGREFTVALLGNGTDVRVLPIVEIDFSTLPEGANPIYSYEAKWLWDTDDDPLQIFHCPAPLEPLLRRSIEDLCRKAFNHLGCRDWCRIDVRLDSEGHPQIIEVNPLPGVLPRPEQNSCFPKAARAAGLSYSEMILSVVDAACERLGLVEKNHAHRRLL
ncbi:D-alanine--D-alanine ligase family protein [Geopsychrobacter electrodiphilus]|uniref:D-alanine--D-alanine ligase family protein n=1 Tax=Geopsychrobacter electrodiphilus TaxID=225196 RepID=UPI00036FB97A|nr:ATP-grasp domain-containing protein [Geopsychrobacter electrodiphilus]